MKNTLRTTQLIRKCISYLVVIAMTCTLASGFVPSKANAAGTYLIRVNKQMNCVTIYRTNAEGKYKPIKALICSTGYATNPGTYSLGEKMRWHVLDGPCYGQYCSRIYGGVLFHSVWYTGENNPSTLSVSSYNKLGTTASHGCVRLTVAGAKWIYNNVPSGTKVVVYNSAKAGPLGKPESIQLPYTCAWDPTDTGNPNNPWNNKKPSISGAQNQTIAYHGTVNLLQGVTAKNTTGFDATKRIKTSIVYHGKKVKKINTTNPGTYKVTYKVKDEIGRKASKTVKVKVTASKSTPKITGVTQKYVTSKSKLTKNFALKGVTITQDGKSLAKKYIQVTFTKIKTGVYRVVYLAQNESVAAKEVTRFYVDSKAPVISGVTNGESYALPEGQSVTKEYALSLIKISDNISTLTTKDVHVAITAEENGTKHKVVYTVSDQAGNQASVTIYLTTSSENAAPAPTVAPAAVSIQGAKNMTLTKAQLNLDSSATTAQIQNSLSVYLLTGAGIKAVTADNQDITSNLSVKVSVTDASTYKADFEVTDASGNKATASITVTMTD